MPTRSATTALSDTSAASPSVASPSAASKALASAGSSAPSAPSETKEEAAQGEAFSTGVPHDLKRVGNPADLLNVPTPELKRAAETRLAQFPKTAKWLGDLQEFSRKDVASRYWRSVKGRWPKLSDSESASDGDEFESDSRPPRGKKRGSIEGEETALSAAIAERVGAEKAATQTAKDAQRATDVRAKAEKTTTQQLQDTTRAAAERATAEIDATNTARAAADKGRKLKRAQEEALRRTNAAVQVTLTHM